MTAKMHRSLPVVFPEWMDRAACAGASSDLFHPSKGNHKGVQQAKAICSRCPVRQDCLEYALREWEIFGIWGGLSVKERAEEARRRRLGM